MRYSYSGKNAPKFALVGKPVFDDNKTIVTFHLVLEDTETGVAVSAKRMKEFMQEVVSALELKECK